MLNESATAPKRLGWAVVFVFLPPFAFFLGHRLGVQERRLKLALRRRWRWRRRQFELIYRSILVGIMLAIGMAAAEWQGLSLTLLAGGVLALGPAAGTLAARRARPGLRRSLVAATAGAGALVFALAGAGVGGFAGGGAFAWAAIGTTALAGAVVLAGAGALACAAVASSALAAALTSPESGAAILTEAGPLPLAGALALVGAAAGAGTIGSVVGSGQPRGAFAGGFGVVAGLGLTVLFFSARVNTSEVAIVSIVLFLILPLVNGFWDWLSWWISRGLGSDLRLKLQPAGSTGRRAMTVAWHTLADLVAAVVLLAAMAYLLAVGFAGYNQVAIALSDEGRGAFGLERFIERAAAAPWTDGLWLTVMLVSTLVPTFLHLIMLLASPIALVALPTEKRLALAADLDTYADQPERQASIRRRAGKYVAREKHGALALATFLLVLLLAMLGWLVRLIHQGGLANYILEVARAGIWTARWVAGLF